MLKSASVLALTGAVLCYLATGAPEFSAEKTTPVQGTAPRQLPGRVILRADFGSGKGGEGPKGEFVIVTNAPAGAVGGAARSVPRRGDGHQMIVLPIAPPRPVGARTQVRFRYHLTGASELVVQIFDATVQDNRHIRLREVKQNEWKEVLLDFSADSRRNDGTANSEFSAGNLVDDLFFFVEGEGARTARLHLDEVVLFDASPENRR